MNVSVLRPLQHSDKMRAPATPVDSCAGTGRVPHLPTQVRTSLVVSSSPAHMNADPHAALRERVLNNVFEGPGESDPALRRAVAEGAGIPADLQALVDKIHRHAYKVTDDDIARLQAKYGDDRMFEIIVSAALGASRQRLLAGLDALEQA